MSAQQELERAITAAWEAGDQERLRALQAEYRLSGLVDRINLGSMGVQEPLGAALRPSQPSTQAGTSLKTVPIAVRLTSEARHQLAEIEFSDVTETGGFMFGRVGGVEIVVEELRGADWGTGYNGERGRIELSGAFAGDWEERLKLSTVGVFHSHPHTRLDEELWLSSVDKKSAVRAAELWRTSFAELLLAPGDDGYGIPWAQPRMRVWIARDGSVRESSLVLEKQRWPR